jgi:propionyl-CoA carboxylase beta chain
MHDPFAQQSPPGWASATLSGLYERHQTLREQAESLAIGQRRRGKLTARERIELLLDPESFVEIGALVRQRSMVPGPTSSNHPHGESVITGHGTVRGHEICVFAQDFTVLGGSLGEVAGEKIVKIMDLAMDARVPVVGINDSVGGRIQEGVVAQAMYGEIFRRNVRLSGVVPQISLIMGPCAGGAVYSPALTDFVVMVEGLSQMFLTGPVVLRDALGEEADLEDLGGAWAHNVRSGAAHHLARTESEAIAYVRELLAHLTGARPFGSVPGKQLADIALNSVIPGPDQPYDVRTVLAPILDGGDLLEVHRWYAPSIVIGFGRLGGRSIGVVANQPSAAAGGLDASAAWKAARFVRTCDAFNIPVLTIVDTPGFVADQHDEWAGAARRLSALVYAYAEASVPLLTVITRNAGGIGYVAMGSRHLKADLCLAWPTARVDGKEPYLAAERGYVDDVIEPARTRIRLLRALRLLEARTAEALPRKHENLPL